MIIIIIITIIMTVMINNKNNIITITKIIKISPRPENTGLMSSRG